MTGQREQKFTERTEHSTSASSGSAETPELTAKNLKSALWETLNDVRSDRLSPGQADTIASQAREILRTTNTQLRIASQSKRVVPMDVIKFSED